MDDPLWRACGPRGQERAKQGSICRAPSTKPASNRGDRRSGRLVQTCGRASACGTGQSSHRIGSSMVIPSPNGRYVADPASATGGEQFIDGDTERTTRAFESDRQSNRWEDVRIDASTKQATADLRATFCRSVGPRHADCGRRPWAERRTAPDRAWRGPDGGFDPTLVLRGVRIIGLGGIRVSMTSI